MLVLMFLILACMGIESYGDVLKMKVEMMVSTHIHSMNMLQLSHESSMRQMVMVGISRMKSLAGL